tara:strand:+ start:100 stop:699 length:600 start_codon:yes stop_codon:yes gene_type:complete
MSLKDLIKTYRGENINLNPFRKRYSSRMNTFGKAMTGKYSTTLAKEAMGYTSKFPNKILSTKITPLEMKIGKKMFHELKPDWTADGVKIKRIRKHISNFSRDTGGRNYNILSKKNLANLKIDPLKTFLSNAKALTPLAAEGLSFISSLPVATLAMVLQSTPANADEVNMKLEDFAKLAEEAQPKNVNIDKALPSEPKDI